MADAVTKEQVYTMLGKRLAEKLKEHTGHVDGIYNTWDKDEKVWLVYPPDNINHVGETHIIVISQKTGDVLIDAMVDE